MNACERLANKLRFNCRPLAVCSDTSPVVNWKQDAVRKYVIRPSCAKDETNTQNVDKREHFDPYWKFTFAALLVGCPNSTVQKP